MNNQSINLRQKIVLYLLAVAFFADALRGLFFKELMEAYFGAKLLDPVVINFLSALMLGFFVLIVLSISSNSSLVAKITLKTFLAISIIISIIAIYSYFSYFDLYPISVYRTVLIGELIQALVIILALIPEKKK